MFTRSAASPRVRWFRLLFGLVIIVFTLAAATEAASAHAVVVSSTPGDGERLSTPPTEVTITFSEGVSGELGGIKVLDATGERVDQGETTQPTPVSLRVGLRPDLPDGSFVANYKIVSADGHAISGAVLFTVGNAAAGDLSGLTASNSPAFEVLFRVGQFLAYLGALLAAGLAFFLAFLDRNPADGARLATITRWSTVAAVVGAALTIVAQAALAGDGGLGSAFQSGTIGPVLRQGLGWSTAALLVGLALCFLSLDLGRGFAAQSVAFYGGLAVAGSFVLWGHATEAERSWLAIPADVVHVAAAAVWLGGLVGVAAVLRSRRRSLDEGSLGHATAVVRRFSGAAASSIVALALAGAALSIAELGSIGAVTSSRYGQTLLVKLAIVAVVLFTAGYNRFFLLPWLLADDAVEEAGAVEEGSPDADGDARDRELVGAEVSTATVVGATADPGADGALADDGGDHAGDDGGRAGEPDDHDDHDAVVREGVAAGWATLRRTLLVEVLGIVAVLAVTAVLVNTTPGSTATAVTGPFQQEKPFRGGTVSLVITPNLVGRNSFHLDFVGADGAAADVAQKVTLELRLPAKDVGPLTRDFIKAGRGHFILENVNDLSIPGDWQVSLIVRVSDFDQERVDFQDKVT